LPQPHRVRDDVEIRLTPKTHRTILRDVWGPNGVAQPEHLWTLVAQHRKKIEPDPSQPKYLVSEPWVGYRFVTVEK
jgi:two-component system KDP operon response regulator KdpE